MTSALSNQNPVQLILSVEDSHAKILAKPERAPAWLARDLACSMNCSESFAWWDRATSCWKTSQRSLTEGWTPFSERWPRQGTTANGRAYRRRLWVPAISGIGGGVLPTPRASHGMSHRLRNSEAIGHHQSRLEDFIAMLPTPRTCSAMAATINSMGNLKGERFRNLETVIGRQLLTPCAKDWKGQTNWEAAERHGPQRLPDCLPTGAATYLNPSFVEEMQGYPIGWTA